VSTVNTNNAKYNNTLWWGFQPEKMSSSKNKHGMKEPLFLLALLCQCRSSFARLSLGVYPATFQEGETLPLKVNALTSIHTQIPSDSQKLPFCASDAGHKSQGSSYTIIKMKKDLYCQQLCQVSLDESDAARLRFHIKYGYNHNWIVDNLPSAAIGMQLKNPVSGLIIRNKRYAGGFPIGYVNSFDKLPYLYNHFNIYVDYHAVKTASISACQEAGDSPECVIVLSGLRWNRSP
jgi:Endomembrane protein 70